jgi:hypothetical protein
MKHASTRAVYEYWNRRRGSRPAPERGDIDPAHIRYALGDTFMLAADFGGELRFRLAGTRVCALFCREIKGESFTEIWNIECRKAVDELLGELNEENAAAVAGVVAHTEDDGRAELEMLLLPLAHSGQARTRALGVLAPTVAPYWLGAQAVSGLELMTVRHIGPDAKSRTAPRFGRAAGGKPLPHGLVVYSGGRETPPGERTG